MFLHCFMMLLCIIRLTLCWIIAALKAICRLKTCYRINLFITQRCDLITDWQAMALLQYIRITITGLNVGFISHLQTHLQTGKAFLCYTLKRKSPTHFVRTKPRGSVVITGPFFLDLSFLGPSRSSQSKLALLHGFAYQSVLSTMFLCKYMKVMWLCESKGFHDFLLRV